MQVFLVLLFLCLLSPPLPAQARDLKLATWNLGWLTLRPAGDPALPDDIPRRSAVDLAHLRAYVTHLNADVIGFQEVDGEAAAARLFPSSTYRLLLTNDPVVQRVGIAIKSGLIITRHDDVTALNVYPPGAPHPLRSGLDVTISDGTASLRLLVVHLKTGCWDNPPTEHAHACPTLVSQFAALEDWILERQDEGEAFAIMGDFNRRLTPTDPFFLTLLHDGPLLLTTAGYASPCWDGEYFIDHILLGGPARSWLKNNSLRVMTYTGANDTPQTMSDHCPVSIHLDLP
ncbi:endonuclease/exonuclease/phosphatase family protein [Acetobacter estunensis]|uniref:endonuclease/exonuclease/phosphatase family protein n=1 Tax=Acetobacter estunensis TaxID=104097 RepID=UPI0034A03114